ncbi:hypothetical protein [Baaleninema simplex]|nr:hypothetical protein [Baaleninema simplex]
MSWFTCFWKLCQRLKTDRAERHGAIALTKALVGSGLDVFDRTY